MGVWHNFQFLGETDISMHNIIAQCNNMTYWNDKMPALGCRTEEGKNYFEIEKMLLGYTAVLPSPSPPHFPPPQKDINDFSS